VAAKAGQAVTRTASVLCRFTTRKTAVGVAGLQAGASKLQLTAISHIGGC
jgi:hypothetical protein